MKNYLLLPNRFKTIGWVIFLIFAGLYVYGNIIFPFIYDGVAMLIPGFTWSYPSYFRWGENNLTVVLLTSGILIGLLMICFSKEKKEDEYISFIRLRSWQWAVLISYGILFLANWLIFGVWFFTFMTFNLITVLIVFIMKFNFSLYRLKQERIVDEK